VGIEIEYPLGYASSGGIVYIMTPGYIYTMCSKNLTDLNYDY